CRVSSSGGPLKFMSSFLFASLLVLGCIAAPVWADVVPVQNASFESVGAFTLSSPTGGVWNTGPIPGWMIMGSGDSGSWRPDLVAAPSYSSLPDGITVAYSNGGSIS